MNLSNYSVQEILEELLRREPTDNNFHLVKETNTSYTIKFFKFT